MRRAALGPIAGMAAYFLCAGLAIAQDEPAPPADAPAEEPAAEPPAAEPPKEGAEPKTPVEEVKPGQKNWQDIYVVPRRAVLKRRRFEIMPTWNVTLNNPVIRHHGFGGALAIYLSETFFIGLEGTYYAHEGLTNGRYFLLGAEQRVIPSVNQYNWSALLDVGYVPIHGKFVLLNTTIFHWETYIAAGVGILQSQVIPRNPADDSFTNFDLTVLLPAIGARMWLARWLAVEAYIKNYLLLDTLESTSRPPGQSGMDAKNNGQSTLVADIVFGLGISLWLPPGFEYKTLR